MSASWTKSRSTVAHPARKVARTHVCTLATLCDEDKEKLRQIMSELDMAVNEREQCRKEMEDQTRHFDQRLNETQIHSNSVAEQTTTLRTKLQQAIGLVRAYQTRVEDLQGLETRVKQLEEALTESQQLADKQAEELAKLHQVPDNHSNVGVQTDFPEIKPNTPIPMHFPGQAGEPLWARSLRPQRPFSSRVARALAIQQEYEDTSDEEPDEIPPAVQLTPAVKHLLTERQSLRESHHSDDRKHVNLDDEAEMLGVIDALYVDL